MPVAIGIQMGDRGLHDADNAHYHTFVCDEDLTSQMDAELEYEAPYQQYEFDG